MEKKHLAVDIGGSHISTCVYDPIEDKMIPSSFTESPISHQSTKEEILNSWSDCIQKSLVAYSIQSIHFSIPGAFDYQNGIGMYTHGKFNALYQVDVRNELAKSLKGIDPDQIYFTNDAEAYALGEYWKGAISESKKALVITLGTGLGACFVFDGNCVKKGEYIPENGELYHLPFGEETADDSFSTRGLLARDKKLTNNELSNAKELADLAHKGDRIALEIFQWFGLDLMNFLEEILSTNQIDTVAIGGNISKALKFFRPSMELNLRICKTELEHMAPMYGVIYSHFYKNVNKPNE